MKALLFPASLLPLRLTAMLTLILGLVYFFKQTPMPYHRRYLGVPFAELGETTKGLIRALLHATGCGLISIGLALGFLAWVPIPAHNPWAIDTAGIMLVATTITMTAITMKVGLYTPWWLVLLSGIGSLWGLWAFSQI
jgi:hypothetical protein